MTDCCCSPRPQLRNLGEEAAGYHLGRMTAPAVETSPPPSLRLEVLVADSPQLWNLGEQAARSLFGCTAAPAVDASSLSLRLRVLLVVWPSFRFLRPISCFCGLTSP
eukprot:CAMPEP_0172801762 /NCGR_PEP_ID=MMETSP1075-20121228/3411_1 /TAXON_ID=2916 /ORGANISM="Ceratium fusus, Strain PA161109" /LENGTH=106 /DNA_ID=CAMNT_0013639887 /DNA_START=968 /DNA_END=1284 /DNA_ORIENTATION=-